MTQRCADDSSPEEGTTKKEMGENSPIDEPWEHAMIRFRVGIAGVQFKAHETAKNKGWWIRHRDPLELVALMHEELSELGRAARNGDPQSEKIPGHTQMAEEAADVVIRLMDACQHWGIDLGAAVIAKMEYNESRPWRHGGLKF